MANQQTWVARATVVGVGIEVLLAAALLIMHRWLSGVLIFVTAVLMAAMFMITRKQRDRS